MAVYSMTGFASAAAKPGTAAATPLGSSERNVDEAAADGTSVTVELRSVNSRFLDLAFRLPDEVRGLEPALRELLGGSFKRGKIEVRMATQLVADEGLPQPRPEQLMKLARLDGTIRTWLPDARPLSVNEALGWCRQGGHPDHLDEAALAAARDAVKGLREARAREGKRLAAILSERVDKLRLLATQAKPLVPAAVARQQQRFLDRWNEALVQTGGAGQVAPEALQERALNEAATQALRIDVAEELSRLNVHLDEIDRLLKAGGELGKRLDFLIQELHREANTLGSKSAALELSAISVEMKVAIEQMREQVQNIE